MKLILSAYPPFSLSTVIQSHGWIQLPAFNTDGEAKELTFVYRLTPGKVVGLRIQETDSGVSVETDCQLSQAEQDEIACKVTWMLGLDQDYSAFYALASNEPKLAYMQERAQGRVLRCPTLFEDVIKTILTTNTLWAHTIRMADALVLEYGDSLPADPARHAFPTAECLAATDEESLRAKARVGYRAPYILGLARAVASGDLDLEALKTADLYTTELRKQLMAIKGVGGYAAANLLMLLGRYAYVPVDSWAIKLVSHEWYNGEPVGQPEVEKAFEHWGEWKGLAFWFWDWSYHNG